jgi:hypothetical protein
MLRWTALFMYEYPYTTPWPESASELYRPSDRHLSAKLVPTFSDRECHHKAEKTPFQTHYFSENLVAPGIESGPLDLQPGTLTTRAQRRSPYTTALYFYSHVASSNSAHAEFVKSFLLKQVSLDCHQPV